jgi:hypothetical protein
VAETSSQGRSNSPEYIPDNLQDGNNMATETITACRRCGRAARGSDGDSQARIYRRSKKGECTECHAVLILKSIDQMHGGKLLPPGATWQEALRLPHVQQQFGALMKAGNAECNVDEINWDRVIEVWDLAADRPGSLF